MGRGWRNAGRKVKVKRSENLSPDAERVYKRIKIAAERCVNEDYAREMYEYRVRYRYGSPARIHYRTKTKLMIDLLGRVAFKQVSHRWALRELEAIEQEP